MKKGDYRKASGKIPEKKPVILLILLSIITLGIYNFFWFIKRAPELNNLKTKNKFNKKLPTIALILHIISIVLILISFILTFFLFGGFLILEPSDFSTGFLGAMIILSLVRFVQGSCSLAAVIIFIINAFQVRTILNQTLENKGEKTKISGFFTFIFNYLYLQYEINRIIDDRENEKRIGPWVALSLVIALSILFFILYIILIIFFLMLG